MNKFIVRRIEKTLKFSYIALIGVFIVLIILIYLISKINYLENRNNFFNLGQEPQRAINPVSSKDYIYGNPLAKVTLVEYSDFECPDCQLFHPTLNKLLSFYGNKIRLVSRRSPLPQNQNAEKEAEAVLCAGKFGGNSAFWKYSNMIYNKIVPTQGGTGLPISLLPIFARNLGLNIENFNKCLNTGEMGSTVLSENSNALAAGINQLPATFIIDSKGNTILISGNQSFELMKTVIDQALAL